jgi:hypothetical protein
VGAENTDTAEERVNRCKRLVPEPKLAGVTRGAGPFGLPDGEVRKDALFEPH